MSIQTFGVDISARWFDVAQAEQVRRFANTPLARPRQGPNRIAVGNQFLHAIRDEILPTGADVGRAL